MEEFVLYVALALMPIGFGCLVGLVIIAYRSRNVRMKFSSKRYAKIDDTSAFGISNHDHSKHRVYVNGLTYGEAILLKSLLNGKVL